MVARKLADGARFSGTALRDRREALGLSRLALLLALRDRGIGVVEKTIFNWETGASLPDANQSAELAVVLKLGSMLDLYEVPAEKKERS